MKVHPNEKKAETTFGAFIRRLRKEKGLSQEALADEVGVTTGYICHLERGYQKNIRDYQIWNGLKLAFGWNELELREAIKLMERCRDAATTSN